MSALSVGVWDFAFYRFLTGLGVGGQFAVGVALVAEVMPDRAASFRPGLAAGPLGGRQHDRGARGHRRWASCKKSGTIGSAWRAMFLIGVAPALLAIPIFLKLKEPERWKAAVREEEQELAGDPKRAHKLGSLAELFGDPRWRQNTIVGHAAGVLGRGRASGASASSAST